MLVEYETVKDDLDRMRKIVNQLELKLRKRNSQLNMLSDLDRYDHFNAQMERVENGEYVLHHKAMMLIEHQINICVFCHLDVRMSIDSVISLTSADVTDDSGFFTSVIGEKFKLGVCDEITLTAKRRNNMEVYFSAKMFKDGQKITDDDYYQDEDLKGSEVWSQDVPFNFAMYLVGKGAKLNKGKESE